MQSLDWHRRGYAPLDLATAFLGGEVMFTYAALGLALFAQLELQSVAAAQIETGEAFNLSIDEAVEVGLERSFRVQRSNRSERMTDRRVDNARAGLRPRFDVSGLVSQDQRYLDHQGAVYDYNQGRPSFHTSANATASIPFDISGVTRRQIRQAEFSHQLSELDLAQVSIDIATEIRTHYVHALRAQEQVRAEEEYVALTSHLLQQALLQQSGVAPFLETERDNAVQSLESMRTSADLTMSNLRQALRLPRDTPINLTNGLPETQQVPSMDMLLETAARNRNDLKQAQVRLDQARLARQQAMDSRRPNLSVNAYAIQSLTGRSPYVFYEKDRDYGRTLNTGVALNLRVPLIQYDGGVLRNNRQIADIQAEQALADAAEAMERAENEITQILIGLNRAQQRLASLPDPAQARSSLERAESLMLAASPSDAPALIAQVTNARQNWRSAVVSRNEAMTDYYSNFFRLQRATGTEEIRAF
jgi:outer membrane protein TolC